MAKAGGDLTDIVKMTVYLRDPLDYSAVNEVRREVLSGVKFASTTVVCDLPAKDALIEIEFIAHLVDGAMPES
jgi:enamine deaminase RidA (YjgF/YER057c/UK114 family)